MKGYASDASAYRLCPRVAAPRNDCYCLDMNSGKIQFALQYCMGEFEKCRIYQSLLREQRSAETGGTGRRPGRAA